MELTEEDFESGPDSTILVRERTKGTRLHNAYLKRKGTLLANSNHTITFLPAGRTQQTTIWKRDQSNVGQSCCSRAAEKQNKLSQATQTKLATPANSSDESIIVIKTIPPTAPKEKDNPEPAAAKIPTPALRQLKSKAKKNQKRRHKAVMKPPQRPEEQPLQEDTVEGDAPNKQTSTTELEEKLTVPDMKKEHQPEMISTKKIEEEVRTPPEPRRGLRARPKPDFFGSNAMTGYLPIAKQSQNNESLAEDKPQCSSW